MTGFDTVERECNHANLDPRHPRDVGGRNGEGPGRRLGPLRRWRVSRRSRHLARESVAYGSGRKWSDRLPGVQLFQRAIRDRSSRHPYADVDHELSGSADTSDTESFRTITYGAMFAVHSPAHQRVDVAFLAGLSDAIYENRSSGSSDTTLLRTGGVVHDEWDYRWSESVGAVTAGIDAAVNLTPMSRSCRRSASTSTPNQAPSRVRR